MLLHLTLVIQKVHFHSLNPILHNIFFIWITKLYEFYVKDMKEWKWSLPRNILWIIINLSIQKGALFHTCAWDQTGANNNEGAPSIPSRAKSKNILLYINETVHHILQKESTTNRCKIFLKILKFFSISIHLDTSTSECPVFQTISGGN